MVSALSVTCWSSAAVGRSSMGEEWLGSRPEAWSVPGVRRRTARTATVP